MNFRGGGGGGGYFGILTLNTESKSAIFEFSRGGGGGGGGDFGILTLNTESKSAIFEFSGGGGGYFGRPKPAATSRNLMLYLLKIQ